MNKLREKLINAWLNHNAPIEVEQITDDFSVKFYDWSLDDGIDIAMQVKSTTELQQYFKENVYNK
jgi:hypothetical protein